MDPNQALRNILEAIRDRNQETDPETQALHLDELLEALAGLSEWIVRGGYAPNASVVANEFLAAHDDGPTTDFDFEEDHQSRPLTVREADEIYNQGPPNQMKSIMVNHNDSRDFDPVGTALRMLNQDVQSGVEFPDAFSSVVLHKQLTEEQAEELKELYDRQG